jgi:hypothetical protein
MGAFQRFGVDFDGLFQGHFHGTRSFMKMSYKG